MKRVTLAKARPQARLVSGTQRGRGVHEREGARATTGEGRQEMRLAKARRHFN